MNADKSVTAIFTTTFPGSSFIFTDDPVTSQVTPVKAVHITELRQAINTLRSRNGLSASVFTDSTLIAGVSPIRAVHITELRTALNPVFGALGQSPPTYTDPAIVPGQTAIKKIHIEEIRSAVRDSDFPDIIGTYVGSGNLTQTNCQDPVDNGTFGFSSTVTISTQTGPNFSGSATLTSVISGITFTTNISLTGTFTTTGQLSGTFTFTALENGAFGGSGNGTFTGQVTGNTATFNFSGQETVGGTCTFTGSMTGTS